MNDSEKSKPKIIIDEDFKSQVAAEKEALKNQEQQGSSPESSPESGPEAEPDRGPESTGTPDAKSGTSAEAEGQAKTDPPRRMPPASFSMLVTSLATQALSAMGQIPDPSGGQPTVDKDVAKHFIDTLAILEDKTKGNLSEAEAAMLQNLLHELRMLFVNVSS